VNYFSNPKPEVVDNTQLTCISIEKLGQVLISVGCLLETGTDLWWLSGWFLGFITRVLKNQRLGNLATKTITALRKFSVHSNDLTMLHFLCLNCHRGQCDLKMLLDEK
jgi:hypothetical protein